MAEDVPDENIDEPVLIPEYEDGHRPGGVCQAAQPHVAMRLFDLPSKGLRLCKTHYQAIVNEAIHRGRYGER